MEPPGRVANLEEVIDLDACEILSWRQGDIFDVQRHPVMLSAGTAADEGVAAAEGFPREQPLVVSRKAEAVVAVAQTCDLVKPPGRRPTASVAPLVTLSDNELREATAGTRPRYVPVPGMSTSSFIDLDYVFPIEKRLLLGKRITAGVTSVNEVRAMSAAIGRTLGRFAFSDEFNKAVEPLTRRLRKKYGGHSEEAAVLATQVLDIFVQADWGTTPYNPNIIVVVAEGVITSSDPPPVPATRLLGAIRTIPEVCAQLTNAASTAEDRTCLWLALKEHWADLCHQSDVVGTITMEVIPEHELTYSVLQGCDQLDLDYLSRAA